jgi:hypothetical protein
MGFATKDVFGFEYIMFANDSTHGVFTHKDLISNIDFKFGVHKVETTYMPSHKLQDFIDEEK